MIAKLIGPAGQIPGGEQPVVLADVVAARSPAAVRPAEAGAGLEVPRGRALRGEEVVADVDLAWGRAGDGRQRQRHRGCRNDQGPSHRFTSGAR